MQVEVEKLDLARFHERAACPVCGDTAFRKVGDLPTIHPRSTLRVAVHQCARCAHWHTTPAPEQDYLSNLYATGSLSVLGAGWGESVAATVAATEPGVAAQAPVAAPHWIFLDEQAQAPGHYLEVGPGDCALLRQFQSTGWVSWAIEPGHWGRGAQQVVADVAELPAELQFDVVVLHDVLEHVSEPATLLQALGTRLRPGGRLYLAIPNADSAEARWLQTRWSMVRPLGHLHYFSRQSVLLLLQQVGCELSYSRQTNVGTERYKVRRAIDRVLRERRYGELRTIVSVLFKRSQDLIGRGDQWHVRAVKAATPR